MEYIKSAMNIAGFPDEARRPILEAAKLVLADSRCAVLTKKLLTFYDELIEKDSKI